MIRYRLFRFEDLVDQESGRVICLLYKVKPQISLFLYSLPVVDNGCIDEPVNSIRIYPYMNTCYYHGYKFLYKVKLSHHKFNTLCVTSLPTGAGSIRDDSQSTGIGTERTQLMSLNSSQASRKFLIVSQLVSIEVLQLEEKINLFLKGSICLNNFST